MIVLPRMDVGAVLLPAVPTWVHEPVAGGDDGARAGTSTRVGETLLSRAVRQGTVLASVYRPGSQVAFAGRDRVSPGFDDAVARAQSFGYAPVLRAPGGRAVAYHRDCLCLELAAPSAQPRRDLIARFAALGTFFVTVLREFGVPASIGAVDGEYCSGAYSVNAGGTVKLVGTAQRIVAGGWLISASVVIARPEPLRRVTAAVYDALDLPFAPHTLGAVVDYVPGIDIDDVAASVRAGLTR